MAKEMEVTKISFTVTGVPEDFLKDFWRKLSQHCMKVNGVVIERTDEMIVEFPMMLNIGEKETIQLFSQMASMHSTIHGIKTIKE